MLTGKGCAILSLTWVAIGLVGGIVTKKDSKNAVEQSDLKKEDIEPAQSIDRDYIAGYDDHYGHGGYGLSAHASYGFPEGYDSYAGYEGDKPHAHFQNDHHHYHHHHEHHDHHDHQNHGGHKHHDPGYQKALAIKGLLVPLAGVALLGAAAAFVSNPVLLQLGVISGTAVAGRKRRDTTSGQSLRNTIVFTEDQARLDHIKLLEKFMAQIPKQEIEAQEKKILASYVSCSGMTTNFCLERLACELHSPEGVSMPMEANVLTIVLNEIISNRFIPDATKISISKAIERGKNDSGCQVYKCQELKEYEEEKE